MLFKIVKNQWSSQSHKLHTNNTYITSQALIFFKRKRKISDRFRRFDSKSYWISLIFVWQSNYIEMGNTTDVIKMNGFKKNSNVLLNSKFLITKSSFQSWGTTSLHLNQYAITSALIWLNLNTSSKQVNLHSLSGILTTTDLLIPLNYFQVWPYFQTLRSKTKSDVNHQQFSFIRCFRFQRGVMAVIDRARVSHLLLN
jgi:hypothetical protein